MKVNMSEDKKYIARVRNITPRPRSKRLRDQGIGSVSNTTVLIGQMQASNVSNAGVANHSHDNLYDLDRITTDNDGYLYLTLSQVNEDGTVTTQIVKVRAGHADDAGLWSGHSWEKYMDQPVRMKDLVEFAGVVAGYFKTPGFIEGLETGTGASIDSDGNAEMQSLRVRSSLKVPLLIYNKVRVTGGEIWNTEGAVIKSVTQDPDSDTAFTLALDLERNETIELAVDDICKGRYNTSAGFVTSYFRVTAVDQAAGTIRIVLGADSEVPGGSNTAPVPFMNIARYGNFTDKERQSSQYFSSTENRICLLTGVDQYIIQESNYAAVLGTIPSALLPSDLPLADSPSILLDHVVAKSFIQIDRGGKVIKTIRDRSLWSAETAVDDPYICDALCQDEVYHKSCKYRCIVNGTTQEPAYDSTDWLLVAGDTSLSLDIESSEGETFLSGQLSTTLTATVKRGVNDITSEILDSDWTWTRETGDTAADAVWNTDHASAKNTIDLKNEDLQGLKGKFVCQAYVRDGAETVSADIEF